MRDWVRKHAAAPAVLALLLAWPMAAPAQETKPEWLALHEQTLAEYQTTLNTFLKTLTDPGHVPGRVVFKAVVAQERKAERLAAKATGEGSADHLAVLDSLANILAMAEAPGDQLAAARRALALRLRDAPPNSLQAAQAKIGFAKAIGLTPAQHEAIGDAALAEARTLLEALPDPMSDERADAWGAYAEVAARNLGATPDVIRVETRIFDYWADRKPVTAEVATKTMTAAIGLSIHLQSAGQLDAVREVRRKVMLVAADDPRPAKPLLNLALVEYGKAALAVRAYPLAISALKWANERLAKDTTPYAARWRGEAEALLAEARAKDAAGLAALRATRAQEAAVEAGRTSSIVPTPGLAAIMAKLKTKGISLEAGTK